MTTATATRTCQTCNQPTANYPHPATGTVTCLDCTYHQAVLATPEFFRADEVAAAKLAQRKAIATRIADEIWG